ncbi:ABC transporter ATP-binding protein [Leptolyngbya sp. AN03gr2]|uniref:ABC transporter ATP-binding protein n=1 Tax=unclassified Leptolyngbya TaxID=2650499 RepID=UPI003D3173C9
MTDTVIQVENLGKRYIINHQQSGNRWNNTFRDVLAQGAKQFAQRLLKPSSHNQRMSREEFWALKDVSFEVKQGDRVGIIGRNGAGKSTLLKVLSRITEPTRGQVDIWGRVASLLEVGTGFHPELTGRENIYLNGAILGMSKAEISRKFDEIVAFAEVEKFLDTPVKRYSSGMYVRLAFAVAAHLEPEILIVDEVLAVGDVQFQKKCLGKMESVANEGRTILFVSHNISAVRNLCKTAVLMKHGQVERQGEVSEVLQYYIQSGATIKATNELPPPKMKDAPGYAVRVSLEDEFGEPASSIPVGRPWQVRVHFVVTKAMPHFIIGMGLCSTEDLPLRTCWSDPCDIQPGEYQMLFREEKIILGAGRYWIVVGLSTAHQTFHYTERAAMLEIAEYSDGAGNFVRVSKVGFMLNPMETSLLDGQGEPLTLASIR